MPDLMGVPADVLNLPDVYRCYQSGLKIRFEAWMLPHLRSDVRRSLEHNYLALAGYTLGCIHGIQGRAAAGDSGETQ